MRIARLFTAHPEAVGETYGGHFVAAAGFGARMVLAGLASDGALQMCKPRHEGGVCVP